MSLLTSGPHVVTVTPRPGIRGGRYNTFQRADGTPVKVRGWMSERDASFLFLAPLPWPGGPHSRVTWEGREFDQQGPARRSTRSPRTAHVEVTLTARSQEVK